MGIARSPCTPKTELRGSRGCNTQNECRKLEQARKKPTLKKLDEIADYLGLNLLAVVTLAIAAQGDQLPSETLQRNALRIRDFEMSGGWELVDE